MYKTFAKITRVLLFDEKSSLTLAQLDNGMYVVGNMLNRVGMDYVPMESIDFYQGYSLDSARHVYNRRLEPKKVSP